MASDAAVREQLRYLDALLIEAYGDGPRQLQDFAQRWASLAESLRLGKEANALSEETLNLARTVTRRIMNLSGAFVRLEEVAQKPLALNSRLEKHIPENTDSIQEDDESEEDDEEELTDDEDAGPPNWNFLREWLIRNMGYPFINEHSTYSDVLQKGNISRHQLVQWVDFLRKRSGWQKAFTSHANNNIEKMRKLWSIFLEDIPDDAQAPSARLPHQAAHDFAEVRVSVTRLIDSGMSPWWDSATSLVLRTWSLPRGELSVEEWSSDDSDIESIIHEDEDLHEMIEQEMCDLDLEPLSLEASQTGQGDTPSVREPLLGFMDCQASGTGPAPEPFDVRRCKRKIEAAFPDISKDAAALSSTEAAYSNTKRRKLDCTSTSYQIYSPSSPVDASCCQGGDGNDTSPSTPLSARTPYSDTDISSSERQTTPSDSSVSPSKLLSSKKATPFVLTDTSIPCTASSTSALDNKLILEEQITAASEPPSSYIRSHLIYHGCKRKREPVDDDYPPSPWGHLGLSSSVHVLPLSTTKRRKQAAYRSINSSPSREHEATDQVQVSFKRRRTNDWDVVKAPKRGRGYLSAANSSHPTELSIGRDDISFSESPPQIHADDLQVQPPTPTRKEQGVTSQHPKDQSGDHALDSLLQEIQSNTRPFDKLGDDAVNTTSWLEYSLITNHLEPPQSNSRDVGDPTHTLDGFSTDTETPSFYSLEEACSPRSILEVQTPSCQFSPSECDGVAQWKQEDDHPTSRSSLSDYPTAINPTNSQAYLSPSEKLYPWG